VLINDLDNWTLFKLFGGLGVILSAITVFVSKLLTERIANKWKENSNFRIEELKGLINKNNSVVTTLTEQVGQNFQKVLDKRIEATELFWDRILKMKASIPSVVYLSYQILVDDELKNESLDRTRSNFGSQISNISLADFTQNLTTNSDHINRQRPFISENLWVLMFAYQGFIGRTVYLLVDGYNQGNIKNWKEDSGIKQITQTVLTDGELTYILKLNSYAYDSMLQLLETKILNELKRLISSEDLTQNSLAELEKINQILKQKPKAHNNG
jgi:hypothetical protein